MLATPPSNVGKHENFAGLDARLNSLQPLHCSAALESGILGTFSINSAPHFPQL
jgi:hypothetical protein